MFLKGKKSGLSKAAAAVVIVIVVAAAGVGALLAPTNTTTQTVTQTVSQTITQSATVTTTVASTVTSLQTPTADNTIDLRANSTVTFAVVGGGGGPERFMVGTLTNPTIKIKAGTTIRIFFVSETLGQLPQHSFVIITSPPPYGIFSEEPDLTPAFLGASTENPFVPERSQFTLSFTADRAGTYYYICGVPGHAHDGMYGKFIVEE